MNEIGRIHSIESFSAVDGPGVRVVVFLQGCFLKCIYCHNPDSWDENSGRLVSVKELLKEVIEYREYTKNGGITLSGGEPLLQAKFSAEFLRCCKEEGFHTAIETAGSVSLEKAQPVLKQTDLLILDLKGLDRQDCRKICSIVIENTLSILDYCEKAEKKVWVRHVLLPGFTLKEEKLEGIANFLKRFCSIKRVELLPFHKMGEFKWEELNFPYILKETNAPTEEEVMKAVDIFKKAGLPIVF